MNMVKKIRAKSAKKKVVIPKGLHRCKKCGEYKGVIKVKDLPRGHSWFKTYYSRRLIDVMCICDGIKCEVCKKKINHRPCSAYFDENTGSLWYVPVFVGWNLVCGECSD